MVAQITSWSEAPEREPLAAKHHNRIIKVVQGQLAAPIRLVDPSGTVLFATTLVGPNVLSESEWKIMLKGNASPTTIRAALHLGAKAGSRATTDAVLLIANDENGAGYQFLHGILFGGSNAAVSGTLGTLIGTGGISVLNGIDLSAATFATTGKILHLPGVSGRSGLYVAPINGTTGLRVLGDFSNDTRKSRLLFQGHDSEATSVPGVGVIPPTGGTRAAWIVYSSTDPDNCHWAALVANATTNLNELRAGNHGTGTARPWAIYFNDVERFRIDDDGTRLPNTKYLRGRNAAGTDDIEIARVNSSDEVEIGNTGQTTRLLGTVIGGAGASAGQAIQVGFEVNSGSNPTTTSASYATLDSMELTMTTQASSLLCIFTGVFSHSTVGASVTVALAIDGGSEQGATEIHAPVANYRFQIATQYLFTGLSAGSHTVRVRWLTSAATATAAAGQRRMSAIEFKE